MLQNLVGLKLWPDLKREVEASWPKFSISSYNY